VGSKFSINGIKAQVVCYWFDFANGLVEESCDVMTLSWRGGDLVLSVHFSSVVIQGIQGEFRENLG
jgi:hypothetical protein